METLAGGLFLAAVNMAIINYLAAPVRAKRPELDLWWLVYAALVTGFLISWFAGVNLFEAHVANVLLGRILTGILVGGGSSLIHDALDQRPEGVLLEAGFESGEVSLTAEIEPAPTEKLGR